VTRTESPGIELRIDSLTHAFGSFTAVDDVSLTVRPGEFMTLLGPSGSGKTTTLNIVAGFLNADRGRVHFGGHDVTNLPPHKRNIGMVFQNYALFPTMSVRDNVGYPLRQRRIRGRAKESRVDEALEMVELGHLARRAPTDLSGGQQQRVALARALVHRPPLLLMDEPLGALDRRLRDTLQIEIARIHRQVGTTVIYVTHDQDEALCLSDRIAVFRDGRIEQVGPPDEIYQRPRSEFVARFVGDSNVFSGRVTSEGALELPSGAVLRGASPALAGPRATMVVRPERMSITDTHPGSLGTQPNSLDATIVEERYLGGTRLLKLAVPGEDRSLLVREDSLRDESRSPGSDVTVCWSPRDAVWVEEDDQVRGSEGDT